MSRGKPAKKRQRNAAIGISLLAHVAVFAIFGQNAAKLIAPDPPRSQTTTLWLMPRLRPLAHEAKARQAAASAVSALSSAAADRSPSKAQVAAPAQNPALTPSQGQPAGAASPALDGNGVGTGVLDALRTSVGCDIGHLAHLTPEEKDRCNQRMGEEAKRGPKFIDTIPPEKRAYYDAVQQAYQASHDPQHAFVRDRYGNIQPWGKGPGVGCGMKFGGPPQPPDHRSLTDKIKATGLLGVDIGPLRCGIVIPQGSLTPEIGIPVP